MRLTVDGDELLTRESGGDDGGVTRCLGAGLGAGLGVGLGAGLVRCTRGSDISYLRAS